MAVFSTNQNRQMYVAKSVDTVDKNSELGTIEVKTTVEGEIYFAYTGYNGGNKKINMRSDLVPLDKITYCKHTPAANLKRKIKSVKIALNGAPILDQVYMVKINIKQAFGIGDDTTYLKYGTFKVTKSTETASDVYAGLKESLERNFSREINSWFKFSADSTGLTIKEDEDQPWNPGKMEKQNVYFDVWGNTVVNKDGIELEAFGKPTITYTEETGANGYKIVDQEIFYMGERGDQYRDTDGLNKINVQYMADAGTNYDALDIHYSFIDSNEGVQKSEKDIYIVAPADVMATLKAKLTTAGVTVTGATASTGGE